MKPVQSMSQELLLLDLPTDPLEDFVRIPGVFRRWELEQVIEDDAEYRVEFAGELSDRTRVFAVYRRDRRTVEIAPGAPVTLVFEAECLAIRAQVTRVNEEGTQLVAVASGADFATDRAAFGLIRELILKAQAKGEPLPSKAPLEVAP